jgi:hypothetical protein
MFPFKPSIDNSRDKKARRALWYPTQAKTGLEWGTQRSLPVKEADHPEKQWPVFCIGN